MHLFVNNQKFSVIKNFPMTWNGWRLAVTAVKTDRVSWGLLYWRRTATLPEDVTVSDGSLYLLVTPETSKVRLSAEW